MFNADAMNMLRGSEIADTRVQPGCCLLDFAMKRVATQVRVVLTELQALRRVLLVLLGRVPAHASHTRLTLLGAFQVDRLPGLVFLLGHLSPRIAPPHGGTPTTIRDGPAVQRRRGPRSGAAAHSVGA